MAAFSAASISTPPTPTAKTELMEIPSTPVNHNDVKDAVVEAKPDRKYVRDRPSSVAPPSTGPVSVISMVPQKDDPRPATPETSGPVSRDETEVVSVPPLKSTSRSDRDVDLQDAPKPADNGSTSSAEAP